MRDESGEYIIGKDDGVIEVRSIRRKGSHEDRWNWEKFETMKGLPWEPVPGKADTEIRSRIVGDKGEKEILPRAIGEDRDKQLREFRIERKEVSCWVCHQGKKHPDHKC